MPQVRVRPLPRRAVPLALALGLAFVLGACSGSSSPGPSSTGSAPQESAATTATATPAALSSSSTTGGNPSSTCSVTTKADVEAAFGGSSTEGQAGDYGVCTFDVSGALKAGDPGDPLGLRVFFDAKYVSFATAKSLMTQAGQPDAVTAIDGLGTEAYYSADLGTGSLLHVQVPGGMLTLGMKNGDLLDGAIVKQSAIDLAKAVLARL